MLTLVFSDRGTPASYRMIEGFGVNTYKWVNKEGEEVLIKYHWKPKLGAKTSTAWKLPASLERIRIFSPETYGRP
jgi:catalase